MLPLKKSFSKPPSQLGEKSQPEYIARQVSSWIKQKVDTGAHIWWFQNRKIQSKEKHTVWTLGKLCLRENRRHKEEKLGQI